MAQNLNKGRRENICFVAQQCIEKSFKAVLCYQQKSVPMTHSIEVLLDRLQSTVPVGADSLIELTDYATVRRYEEGSEIITSEDVQAIITAAQGVLIWAKQQIGN